MTIDARVLTLEADGIPGYMARPDGPGPRPGVLMVHHAHGVTADYKIDAYRLAQLGFNVLAPSLFNMFGVPGTSHIGQGADLQAKHSDPEFLGKMEEAWRYLIDRMGSDPARTACIGHCMGGRLLIPFAADHPQVRAIVLYYPSVRDEPETSHGRATPSTWPRRSAARRSSSAAAWTTSPHRPSRVRSGRVSSPAASRWSGTSSPTPTTASATRTTPASSHTTPTSLGRS
jgi:dienelactone hydrolase